MRCQSIANLLKTPWKTNVVKQTHISLTLKKKHNSWPIPCRKIRAMKDFHKTCGFSGLEFNPPNPLQQSANNKKNVPFQKQVSNTNKTHGFKTKQNHGGVFYTFSAPVNAKADFLVQASKSPKEEPLVVEVVHWEDHICRPTQET